jgi:hypothetical protein
VFIPAGQNYSTRGAANFDKSSRVKVSWKFHIDSAGTATATLAPDFTLPLTFSFTLMNPSGAAVNTLAFTCDLATIKVFPRMLSASVVLNKSTATLKSFSF